MATVTVATVLTTLASAGALPAQITKVEAAITTYVEDIEGKISDGATKLAAVVAAAEAYATTEFPTLKVDYTALKGETTSFVNGLVALYNTAKVFVKGEIAAIEKAL